jgi:hypothetical protein
MVGSLERIEQDIAAINQMVVALADELHRAYSSYLNALGSSVQQQLILASYHVCTQGYPEQFLHLPYNQRQQLQQTLRNLAHQTKEDVLAQLHPPVVVEDPDLTDAHPPNHQSWLDNLPLIQKPRPVASENPVPRSLRPSDLIEWQENLEHAIAQDLHAVSHATNRLLQQAGVLPKQLPETILTSAAKAEMADIGGSTPNLLNLLVEAGGENGAERSEDEDPHGHGIMHIVAIHLRLVEIEFADPTLNASRTQIRSLSAQLKTLEREYQKKQRERAIAEAQAAWRLSWSDE